MANKEPQKLQGNDVITLREGTFLQGEVLNPSFTIKTVFGNVIIKTPDIVRITLQPPPHEIATRYHDVLKGQILDTECKLRLSDGQTLTIRMADIVSIQFLFHFFNMLKESSKSK